MESPPTKFKRKPQALQPGANVEPAVSDRTDRLIDQDESKVRWKNVKKNAGRERIAESLRQVADHVQDGQQPRKSLGNREHNQGHHPNARRG
jgi:hypothetical protein